jgi:hypothetical protein
MQVAMKSTPASFIAVTTVLAPPPMPKGRSSLTYAISAPISSAYRSTASAIVFVHTLEFSESP